MSISKINLKNDLTTIIKQYVKVLERLSPNLHYYSQIKDEKDFNKLCLLYYNLTNRLVEPRPREVHKSSIFYCPSKFRSVLEKIEEKIEKGEEITQYLSRGVQWVDDKSIKRNRHRDALLDAWGIHHIHLGAYIESNGFVKRSGSILFLKFDNDNVYFLMIKRHGRKGKRMHDPWNSQILIEILHKNWSKSIDDYEAKVALVKASDDEIKQWKKGNINVPVTSKDGTTYFTPGGGVALSGDNIQNVRICHYIFRYLDIVEKFLRENVKELILLMKQHGKEVEPSLEFELVFFEFLGLRLNLEIFERNFQVLINFEEGRSPRLLFEKD